jgi:hypothetical protein
LNIHFAQRRRAHEHSCYDSSDSSIEDIIDSSRLD